ncbi:MAG: Maf family protein [Planctomycetota bacterium]
MRLYLASTSPRRSDLLRRAGYVFDCVPPGVEPADPGAPASVAAERARAKCLGARVPATAPAGLVLGVDTVVDLDGRELGKPRDRADARSMLMALAGAEHTVHTAHCLRWHPVGAGGSAEVFERTSAARVRIRSLAAGEVEAYLDTGDWRDKAGGYGIQSMTGSFCTLLSGHEGTVIGLDVEALAALCRQAASGPAPP